MTNGVGSTNVFNILFINGTTVLIYAYDKNVYGLHADSYLINFKFDVDWSNVELIIIDNCY